MEASSAHLPVRKDGGLGMRSYRGIPGFELVPPTKSIAPVRPPREELFLFSHSSYNRPNPPSHPPTSSSYADGIGQSSSASRGFVKELRIHAHQLWNRACHQGWSALRIPAFSFLLAIYRRYTPLLPVILGNEMGIEPTNPFYR